MNRFNIQAIAVAISLAFSAAATAQSMSKAEFKSGRDAIAANYKASIAACSPMSGNARDLCKAKAKGEQNVAKAELDARYAPSDKNRYAASVAKAKADYVMAAEKCDDKSGEDKKVCVKDAKAAESRAMTEDKAGMTAKSAAKPAKSTAKASTPKKETAGEYVDDAVITTKVKAAVLEESSLKSAEINVETYKGIVQLSGFVRSRADINKAVEVARKVKGVASVKNVMIVKGQQ